MKKPVNDVARWRKTLDDLGSQKTEAQQRVDDLKEKKRPLTLKAHTGDKEARGKLDAINSDLMAASQDLEDLDEAVSQAEGNLAEAERVVNEALEAERLRALSDLAEQRVGVAEKIEEQLHELAATLSEYEDVGTEVSRFLGPEDDGIARKLDGSGRLGLTFGRVLGNLIEPEKISRNPVDPRRGQAFPDMERDALSRLLLSPTGAKRKRRSATAAFQD
jgi:hypothetical protein